MTAPRQFAAPDGAAPVAAVKLGARLAEQMAPWAGNVLQSSLAGKRRAGRQASVSCRRTRSSKCRAEQACAGPMTDSMLVAAAASGGLPAPRSLGIHATAGPLRPRVASRLAGPS
jgi:hypothetical protein